MADCPQATQEEKVKIREKGEAKAKGKGDKGKNSQSYGGKGWPTPQQWGGMYPGPTMQLWKSWYQGGKGKGTAGGAAASVTPHDPLSGFIPMNYFGEKAEPVPRAGNEESVDESPKMPELNECEMSLLVEQARKRNLAKVARKKSTCGCRDPSCNQFRALEVEDSSEDDEESQRDDCCAQEGLTPSDEDDMRSLPSGSTPAESPEPSESGLTRCEPKLSKDSMRIEEGTPANAAAKNRKKKAAKAKRKAKEEHRRKEQSELFAEVTGVMKVPVSMLNEVSKPGLNSMPQATEEDWEEILMIIDSGASVPVMPPDMAKAYTLEESDASRRGTEYECANGHSIPNLGQKRMAIFTAEGTLRGYTSQCADVSKPLQSVRHLVKTGHAVVFDDTGSYIWNKSTNETNHIVDDGINYSMKALIVPPKQIGAAKEFEAAGFARPAP